MFTCNSLLINTLSQRCNLVNETKTKWTDLIGPYVATVPRDCVSFDPKNKKQLMKTKKWGFNT